MLETAQSTYRILIVDDNPQIHNDFRKILVREKNDSKFAELERAFLNEPEDCNFDGAMSMELDSAFQGEQALEMVTHSMTDGMPFDMAFVDMRMPPGWDGLETIERLWQVDPDLQIVICTAYCDFSWSEILSKLGQTDKLLVLKKPFDNSEVYQLAAALSRKRELSDQASSRLVDAEKIVESRTRELRIAHQASERLLNSISSVVVELDHQGIVVRWNQTAESVFSLPSVNAIGQSFKHLPIDWKDPVSVHEFVTTEQVNDSLLGEFEFYDQQKTPTIVGLTGYPVVMDDQTQGFLILGKDLTEQKLMEQQLQAAQKLEAVGQLAAGVAHEINTPMQYLGDNVKYVKRSFEDVIQIIQAYQEIISGLEAGSPDYRIPDSAKVDIKTERIKSLIKQIPEALEDSEEGVANVSRIVRAMKQFSHPGQTSKTLVDLNQSLESTLTVAANEWKYLATVETSYDKRLRPVSAFPGELNQVFLNLIINAVHAIAEKPEANRPGKISVATRAGETTAEIRISDDGAGIPSELQSQVFNPLFTTKAIGKGTGQGLALAHQVVANHGGSIGFESESGQGTTFIIQLPYETELGTAGVV